MKGILVAALMCAMASRAMVAQPYCSGAYPNGLGAGTFKVHVALHVQAQDRMTYVSPASASQELQDTFEQSLQQDAASNPSGPQFTFLASGGGQDLGLTIGVMSSGRDPDVADQAWVELTVEDAHVGGLIEWTGSAVT